MTDEERERWLDRHAQAGRERRTARAAMQAEAESWAARVAELEKGPGRRFPIQQYGTIPWCVAEEAYRVYLARYHSGQSLEQLAARGGFGVEEMGMFLPDWRERVEKTEGLLARVAELERELGRVLMWCDEPARLLGTVCDSYMTGLRAAKRQVKELLGRAARKDVP